MPSMTAVKNALGAATGLATMAGAGLLAYANRVEPEWLEVTQVELPLPRLSPAFDSYRIAQISDLHMEAWRRWNVLDEAIRLINEANVDLIVITGDFVERCVDQIGEQFSTTLSQLRARDGVLGILGNHDYWHDARQVAQVMEDAGIMNISNDVHTLHRGGAALHIAGVDTYLEYQARLDLVLEKLPDDGAAILLAHEPDFAFVSVPTRRFDLQLSGHSHGGQIRLPFLTKLALPKLARHFVAGLYRPGGMLLYVNRGLGMTDWQFRFNCRPEVTLITLCAP